jgi:hypothetical protein
VDVSDPQNPNEVGFYNTPGTGRDPVAVGEYIYQADDASGLEVIQFNGAGIEETPNADLRTLNVDPTFVRAILLLPQLLSPHASLLSIDGRKVLDLYAGANDISRLAPGVYFVQTTTGTRHASTLRVVVAR